MIAQPVGEYQILPQYHSQPRKLKIIHVGAGASGLLFAYKARRQLLNYELICYEKNPSIGGTWFENKYPGCACDIPAHTYTYTFQPNTEWSGFYSYSDEILAYFQNFHDQHQLAPYIKLNTEVLSATWDEETAEWELELKTAEGIFNDRCHVLVNGSGVVNKWKWPAINNRTSYKGTLAHSANWDTSISWQGKKVAVIGTGSSSIQMVPEMARGSQSLTVFARSPTYVTPLVSPGDRRVHPDGQKPAGAGKHRYLEVEKQIFRTDSARHLEYRKEQEAVLTEQFQIFIRGTQESAMAKEAMTAQMIARIGPGHEELKRRFIPDWAVGCRRLTPGEGYLETLTQDHVRVVFDEIDHFTETGLATAAGEQLDFDIIACATGFDVSFIPHFKIIGKNGSSMQEEWKRSINIYLGISAPNYPNYFVINGPTANWGNGCVMPSHEVHIEYVIKCCRKLQEEGILAMEPRQEPTTQINQHIDTWHQKCGIWSDNCKSWYKDNKIDGRVYIWGGSLLHHLKTLRDPRYEHYDLRYQQENMWAFLGNGRIDLEHEWHNGRDIDLTPYIRNEDTPWSLELPRDLPLRAEVEEAQ